VVVLTNYIITISSWYSYAKLLRDIYYYTGSLERGLVSPQFSSRAIQQIRPHLQHHTSYSKDGFTHRFPLYLKLSMSPISYLYLIFCTYIVCLDLNSFKNRCVDCLFRPVFDTSFYPARDPYLSIWSVLLYDKILIISHSVKSTRCADNIRIFVAELYFTGVYYWEHRVSVHCSNSNWSPSPKERLGLHTAHQAGRKF